MNAFLLTDHKVCFCIDISERREQSLPTELVSVMQRPREPSVHSKGRGEITTKPKSAFGVLPCHYGVYLNTEIFNGVHQLKPFCEVEYFGKMLDSTALKRPAFFLYFHHSLPSQELINILLVPNS